MSEGEFAQDLSMAISNFSLRCRGATPETVKKAFEILLSDKGVKSIFINIFGGKCIRIDSHKP